MLRPAATRRAIFSSFLRYGQPALVEDRDAGLGTPGSIFNIAESGRDAAPARQLPAAARPGDRTLHHGVRHRVIGSCKQLRKHVTVKSRIPFRTCEVFEHFKLLAW
eukprot:749229-Hanusia_phi.AAC.1